jgi:peptidoglycan hydrolase-like protein with peptidoglycan-binding domain
VSPAAFGGRAPGARDRLQAMGECRLKPIREGDRGAAVEDVQRRLRALGADIGPSGVDGVFLGATLAAVREFQREHALDEDGSVGPATWAALVDATFTLGDRLLYLHMPYFHGADVRTLQGALNSLGFAAGAADGIFGAFAERAVRDFQANCGLPADGIVGPGTVRALVNLRHVWTGKPQDAPPGQRGGPARAADALARARVILQPADGPGAVVAERLRNLALASNPDAAVTVSEGQRTPHDLAIVLGEQGASDGSPTVLAGTAGAALSRRLEVAMRAATCRPAVVHVALGDDARDEEELQRLAVALLDGVCAGLAGAPPTVVP